MPEGGFGPRSAGSFANTMRIDRSQQYLRSLLGGRSEEGSTGSQSSTRSTTGGIKDRVTLSTPSGGSAAASTAGASSIQDQVTLSAQGTGATVTAVQALFSKPLAPLTAEQLAATASAAPAAAAPASAATRFQPMNKSYSFAQVDPAQAPKSSQYTLLSANNNQLPAEPTDAAGAAKAAAAKQSLGAALEKAGLDPAGYKMTYWEQLVYTPGGAYTNRYLSVQDPQGRIAEFDADLTAIDASSTAKSLASLATSA